MVSKYGSSGKTGKGLGSGWVTSGGLGGGLGVESTHDRVSGGEDCNGGASDISRKDCSVTTESGRWLTIRVVRLGAVMAAEGCLQRHLL